MHPSLPRSLPRARAIGTIMRACCHTHTSIMRMTPNTAPLTQPEDASTCAQLPASDSAQGDVTTATSGNGTAYIEG